VLFKVITIGSSSDYKDLPPTVGFVTKSETKRLKEKKRDRGREEKEKEKL